MIDKMYINYENEEKIYKNYEEEPDIIARSSDDEESYWYVMVSTDGETYRHLPDKNDNYAKKPYKANDVPIYNVDIDENGMLISFRSENGFVYKATDLKRYLDYHLDNQSEPVESSEVGTFNDMVSSDFEYKIGKVNSALGALTFMEYQGVSHEMVVQAMNDVRDNIDAYLNQSKRWKNE